MADIFDDLIGGGADEGPLGNATTVQAGGVLVVSERAPSGQALEVEEMVFLRTAGIPQVVFESADPETDEAIFDNEPEFRAAMGSLTPVTVDAALAWCGERVGAVYAAYREEIDAANTGEAAKPPGADAVQPRARMPHSTGTRRGQDR